MKSGRTRLIGVFGRKGREGAMALQIAETPVLRGLEAKKFARKIERDLKRPTTLKDTPKLEEARKAVREHAARQKK